jgi:hypothetical protein
MEIFFKQKIWDQQIGVYFMFYLFRCYIKWHFYNPFAWILDIPKMDYNGRWDVFFIAICSFGIIRIILLTIKDLRSHKK